MTAQHNSNTAARVGLQSTSRPLYRVRRSASMASPTGFFDIVGSSSDKKKWSNAGTASSSSVASFVSSVPDYSELDVQLQASRSST